MITLLKLSTGEDLIGVVTPIDGGKIRIENAAQVQPIVSDSNITIQFFPWSMSLFSETSVVELNTAQIVAEAPAAPELQERYAKMFGGIITPSQQIIV